MDQSRGHLDGEMLLLTARWVFPVATPPIEDGAVLVHEGRIVRVGRRGDLAAGGGGERRDLGQAVILPGLVNCHTHLELSGLGPIPEAGFVSWLLEVRARRQALPVPAQAEAAEAAARALLGSGVTCVGEVSTSGQSFGPLRRAGLRGVVYREVLGVDAERAPELLEAARADLDRMRAERSPLLRVGLSPHSPYALSEELLVLCGRLARETGAPACTHAAESVEEADYLRTGDGEIPRRLYPAVGIEAPPRRRRAASPLAYLEDLGALVERSLLVHAVHVDGEDLRRMRRHRLRVAHCPRSNARLSRGTAPVPAFLAAGVPVGLGTDSLASVPSLDLWDEMRAALQANALDPGAVLRMATLGGAEALGLDAEVGSLEAGKQADLIAVSAPRVRSRDPEGSLLESAAGRDVVLALIGGARRDCRMEVNGRCA